MFIDAFKACLHCHKSVKSPYTTLMHLYVCFISLDIVDFLGAGWSCHEEAREGWYARDRSKESDWQSSALTNADSVPECSNQNGPGPVSITRGSQDPRYPSMLQIFLKILLSFLLVLFLNLYQTTSIQKRLIPNVQYPVRPMASPATSWFHQYPSLFTPTLRRLMSYHRCF